MAEPWLSTVEKLTEFFATDQIEASARRTKFVQRTSKITGKLFLALMTFGRWSAPHTTVPQLVAKAAQLDVPVEVTPEALQQRMTARAVAFLRDLLQTAFAKLHTGETICDDGLFTPFPRVHIADSTGFGLPESLQAEFPGAGGSGSKAGAKVQLVWDYKSQTFDHFALVPWKVPDNKYVETVVDLAQPHSLFVFDLGYFKLAAFAKIVAARAYFLSRLNHQTTLREVVGGRQQSLDLAHDLTHERRAVLEKAVVLGAHERVPARLIAVRMPEAIGNERRRQVYALAKQRGYTPSQAHLTLVAWNLFITNVPAMIWPPQTVGIVYSLRWQVGVSSQGSLTQSVQVRPRPRDSGLVAREAPGRESQPVKPSDNTLCKESAQRSRLQRAVNAAVASLHASPVAEPVYYVRRQQGPGERSLQRRSSPAGYQRRHGAKGERATGEVRGVRRRKLAAEAWPITVSGKGLGWHPDGGSGRSTENPRAAKRVGREGPGPVGIPCGKGRQG
jgi:hypothetical protein